VVDGCATPEEVAACAALGNGDECVVDGFGGRCAGGACIAARCGDGELDPTEQCDGDEIADASCVSAGYYGGTLTCSAECELDVTQCTGRCGDGMLDAADEVCDTFSATSCFDLGFSYGRAGCTSQCNVTGEQCLQYRWRVRATSPDVFIQTWTTGEQTFAILANRDIVRIRPGLPTERWQGLFTGAPNSIDGVGPTDVYALSGAELLHFDGTTWSVVPTGLTGMYALSVYSTSRLVVAAGLSMNVYDGTTWSTPIPTDRFYQAMTTTATEIFAVADDNIFMYDGNNWVVKTPQGAIQDVARSGDTIVATGDDVNVWDGAAFRIVPDLPIYLQSITPLGNGRFLANQGLNLIYEYDGRTWVKLRPPSTVSDAPLAGAWIDSSGRLSIASTYFVYTADVREADRDYTALNSRLLWVFPNSLWESRQFAVWRNHNAIPNSAMYSHAAWGTIDPTDGEVVFLARDDGGSPPSVRFDRCTTSICQPQDGDFQQLILSMSGTSSNDVWALEGPAPVQLRHFNGQSWAIVDAGTLPDLRAISAVAPNDVYVCGANGTVLHYNGTNWTPMTTGVSSTLTSIVAFPGGRAFAIGDGVAIELDQGVWKQSFTPIGTLRRLAGSSFDDVFALGDQAMYHRDGQGWLQSELPTLPGSATSVLLNDDGIWINTAGAYTRITPRLR